MSEQSSGFPPNWVERYKELLEETDKSLGELALKAESEGDNT